MTESEYVRMASPLGARLIWLVSDANPDAESRERYRRVVERSAAPAYPSLLTQAGNAATAAVRFAASGFARVDQAEYDRRRSICAGCEYFDAASERCRKCGCPLATKPWLKSERCPVGKWATPPATPE